MSDDPCPICGKEPVGLFFESIGVGTIVATILGAAFWVWSHLTWTW